MNLATRYKIEAANVEAHLFKISLTIPQPASEQMVSLPVWIPGSYLIREFARHISALQATQNGQSLSLHQADKTTWTITCESRKPLLLEYWVYAHDSSVRGAFLDSQRGFFNGASVFLRVHGRENLPQLLRIGKLPAGWSVATSLQPVKVNEHGLGEYQALDYDDLIDHPVELGHFWRGHFVAQGIAHELVVTGAWPQFDSARLLQDTRKICEAQIKFWHGRKKPPFERYVFLLNAMDDHYGGLEHRCSTALAASRRDLPRYGQSALSEGYVTLLGLISHEYFHTWNVKRLKPRAFEVYDYSAENYTSLLWFFEGFTSYYDDLFLVRTGLIDEGRYLQILSKTINQVQATPGRKVQSVAEASFDAWVKYYRPDENTANSTVSYYTKGALVALALDLSLRQAGSQLDRVMQRLWSLQRGIEETDIVAAIAAETDQTLADTFLGWVHSTLDLPLRDLLATQGVELLSAKVPIFPTNAAELGLRLSEGSTGLKVQAVMRGSVAECSGISAGDELLGCNGWRLRKAEELSIFLSPTDQATAKHQQAGSGTPTPTGTPSHQLLIARDQRLLTLPLQPARDFVHALISLQINAQADKDCQTARQAWLN